MPIDWFEEEDAMAEKHADHHHRNTGADDARKVKDPVCGMLVDPGTAAYRVAYKGQTYFFCSAGCKAKFEAEPARYAGDGSGPPI